MKNLFCFLLFILFTANIYAQKIVSDEYTSDGSRIVTTSVKRVGTINNKFVLWIGMSACVSNDITNYFIQTEYTGAYKMSVNNESSLLLKTQKDDVINLKTHVSPFSYYSGKSWTEHTTIGKMIDEIEHLTKFYSIDETDLNKLFADGVSKIRVQIDVKGESIHDKVLKKDEIGPILKNCKDLLDEKLSSSPTKQSITDDF